MLTRSLTLLAWHLALWLGSFAQPVQAQDPGVPEDDVTVEELNARGIEMVDAEAFEGARYLFSRAIELYPDHPDAYGNLGYVLWLQDKNREARRHLRQAVRIDPEPWILGILARTEFELGEYQDSIQHARAAIAGDPDDAQAHYALGLSLKATGQYREADEAFARAAEIDPEFGEIELDWGELWDRFKSLLLIAVVVLLVLTCVGIVNAKPLAAALETVPKRHVGLRYDGDQRELFRIYLQNIALTLLTLGIYRFWARVRIQRFRYRHTEFLDGRFDFHATGKEKFIGFCKGLVLLGPLIAVLWIVKGLLEPSLGPDLAFSVCFWSFLLLLFLLRPLILVGGQRFRLSRTSWNNLRFRFTGKVKDAYDLYLRDGVLLVITFGFYYAWHSCNVRRFRMQHSKMGDSEFEYRGNGGDLFGLITLGTLLCYITLGLYVPWQIARLHKYHVDSTRFRGRRFHSRMTGGFVLWTLAPALLVVILTAGLAIPWAIQRWYRLVTNTTSYTGEFDPEELQSIHDSASSSVVEGLGEAGDALAEIGDLFGG